MLSHRSARLDQRVSQIDDRRTRTQAQSHSGMASTWMRMKLHYLGSIRVSRLLAPVVLLAMVVLIFRFLRGPSLGLVMYRHESRQHKMLEPEIDEYIRALEDTRPEPCMAEYYHTVKQQKPVVSILLDFHDDELYNLKLALTSIVRNTPSDLYSEIIVLDDGTPDAELRQHAAQFMKGSHFKKLTAYRSEEKHGPAVTRFKASQVAKGDILVFVGSSVVVNTGWLEPLLDAVLDNQDRIVVPHSDNMLSEKRFFKTDNNLVNVLTWPLSTVYMESTDSNPTLIDSPLMRGDVMAVSKNFLHSTGNYDESITEGGGQDLELSLRTWLCGGEIKVALCSRVATHSAFKPLEISNPSNLRRISELWLSDYKNTIYKQSHLDPTLTSEEKQSLQIRQVNLRQLMPQCKPFSWYLSHVAPEILAPSDDMAFYGKIKAMTSYCVRSLADDSADVDMVLCRPYMYDSTMMFELDKHGSIRKGDSCLTVGSHSKVSLSACREGDDKQRWVFSNEGQLTNVGTSTCLTHETSLVDSLENTRRHILSVLGCGSHTDGRRQTWTFINY